VELARRHPPTDGELQLWRWTAGPVTVTGDTEEAELLADDG
jgi:hypothetical protein